jgi:dTDP-4-amino-4,6-dideoxygalactose transaminase
VIPISQPLLGREVEAEVIEVLRSGQLAQGKKVAELEQMFKDLTGCRYAVAVSSGTVALELALHILDLDPRDEVLTTPFTFVATLNAILHSGATATFVDIDENGLLDLDLLAEHMTPRTRVIVPVHLYGLPVDLGSVETPPGITIVEDAAQAVGASIGDRPVGSFGVGCFSLYATKNITTGEGGVITTDDERVGDAAGLVRNQGMKGPYEYVMPGHNYRMTDLQAAVGLPQMRRLVAINQARRANALRYLDGLSQVGGIALPISPENRTHVWHQFTIRVTDEAPITRDDLASRLAAGGVATGVYYPRLVFDYECFRDHPQIRSRPLPNASMWARQALSLPVHPGVSPEEVERVIHLVKEAIDA